MSILFAAIPFAFAAIRAFRTGYDFRYLWLALASLMAALAVAAVGNAYLQIRNSTALSAAVFIIATSLAVLTARLLGTAVGPGSLIVGAAFGFCNAASCGLYLLARR